jgi:hypothetical protein
MVDNRISHLKIIRKNCVSLKEVEIRVFKGSVIGVVYVIVGWFLVVVSQS